MNSIEAILKRRSVRKFKDTPVSKENITTLLECAMAAPSGRNKQPWEFYIVDNLNTLEKMKKFHPFIRMNAPLAIVVCGNLDRDFLGYWVQDCSSAITNILNACVELNLGATWCGVHPVDRLVNPTRECLNIPNNIVPLGIIMIGHPDVEVEPRTQYNEEYIHFKSDK